MAESVLFKNVTVVDVEGPLHLQQVDLLCTRDQLSINPTDVPAGTTTIQQPNLHVSAGWVDIGTGTGEPGHEEQETLASVQAAGLRGGYTHLVLQPNAEPALDSLSSLSGVLAKARALQTANNPVAMTLLAPLSKGRAGKELAEVGELAAAGVKLFGDGLHAITDAKLLDIALGYCKPFGATVVAYPDEPRLSGAGQIHEGLHSTHMGTPGIPTHCETIGLDRDLQIQAYRESKLHVHAVSAQASVQRLERAKHETTDVSFGIPVLNLLLTDEDLTQYNVNLKVKPPLRGKEDRQSLRAALKTGQADALISNHRPVELESKRVEFPYAAFGAATLEDTYAIATTALEDGRLVADYLGRRNRQIAGLDPVTIAPGPSASLTFFDPQIQHVVSASDHATLGVNIPLPNRELKGKPFGIFVPEFGFRKSTT